MEQQVAKNENLITPLTGENKANMCCFNQCRRKPGKTIFGYPVYMWKNRFDSVLALLGSLVILSLLIGLIIPLVFYELELEGIQDAVVISSKSSTSYDIWQSNIYGKGKKPIIHYDIYIFDLQNPETSLNGSKPIVVERGPYAFREYYNKFDIYWTGGGNVVHYKSQRFYVFDASRTGPGLTPTDIVTIPYATVVGFNYLLSQIPVETQQMLDYYVESQIDAKLTAIEAQINAQEDAIRNDPTLTPVQKQQQIAQLEALKAVLNQVQLGINEYLESAGAGQSLLKILLCGGNNMGVSPYWKTTPIDAYFGWLNDPILVEVQMLLNQMNKSDVYWSTSVPGVAVNYTSVDDAIRRGGGEVVQKTGKKDTKEVGKIVTYHNQTIQWVCLDTSKSQQSPEYQQGVNFPACQNYQADWTPEQALAKGYVQAFATDYANRIEGTDGNMFGSPILGDQVQIYVSDIYRTVFLNYEKDTTDWHGVTLRRYGLQKKDLQNYTTNPSEAGQYYSFGPSGLENLTAATGTTLFASKPHFLDADTILSASIVGLSPKRDIHDTYLDIEPNTGALSRAHKRLQVLYQLDDVKLPELSPATANAIFTLCNSTENVTISCDNLDLTLKCLAIPSNWKFYNQRVYLPYAWCDEWTVGRHSDAKSIKHGIYETDEFANYIRLWSYIIAGVIAAIVVGMYAGRFIFQNERTFEEDEEAGRARSTQSHQI